MCLQGKKEESYENEYLTLAMKTCQFILGHRHLFESKCISNEERLTGFLDREENDVRKGVSKRIRAGVQIDWHVDTSNYDEVNLKPKGHGT